MDAYRTLQGTAVFSATTWAVRGDAVATPIRICDPIELLPRDRKQSLQEFKPLNNSVNQQNSTSPSPYRV